MLQGLFVAMKKPCKKQEGGEPKETKETTTDALAQAESLALATLGDTSNTAPKGTPTTKAAVPKAKTKAKQFAKAKAKSVAKAKTKQIAKAKAKQAATAKAKVANKNCKKTGNKEEDKNKKGGKGHPSENTGHLPIDVFSNAIGLLTVLGLLVVVGALCCRIIFSHNGRFCILQHTS